VLAHVVRLAQRPEVNVAAFCLQATGNTANKVKNVCKQLGSAAAAKHGNCIAAAGVAALGWLLAGGFE
jgi:hypothetical protein